MSLLVTLLSVSVNNVIDGSIVNQINSVHVFSPARPTHASNQEGAGVQVNINFGSLLQLRNRWF
jgi:hypothetical protein